MFVLRDWDKNVDELLLEDFFFGKEQWGKWTHLFYLWMGGKLPKLRMHRPEKKIGTWFTNTVRSLDHKLDLSHKAESSIRSCVTLRIEGPNNQTTHSLWTLFKCGSNFIQCKIIKERLRWKVPYYSSWLIYNAESHAMIWTFIEDTLSSSYKNIW